MMDAFCTKHAGKSILFVGDSTQALFYVAFVAMFRTPWLAWANSTRQPCLEPVSLQKSQRNNVDIFDHSADVCTARSTAPVNARFVRNEHLLHDDAASDKRAFRYEHRMSCRWYEASQRADLLVLNRGAHVRQDDEFERELSDTLHNLTATKRADRIVYRSTVCAVPNCYDYQDPSLEPIEVNRSAPFGWGLFGEQNKIARRLVDRVGAVFLDVHRATCMRPQRHFNDCMHYCVGTSGALDSLVELLLALWTI